MQRDNCNVNNNDDEISIDERMFNFAEEDVKHVVMTRGSSTSNSFPDLSEEDPTDHPPPSLCNDDDSDSSSLIVEDGYEQQQQQQPQPQQQPQQGEVDDDDEEQLPHHPSFISQRRGRRRRRLPTDNTTVTAPATVDTSLRDHHNQEQDEEEKYDEANTSNNSSNCDSLDSNKAEISYEIQIDMTKINHQSRGEKDLKNDYDDKKDDESILLGLESLTLESSCTFGPAICRANEIHSSTAENNKSYNNTFNNNNSNSTKDEPPKELPSKEQQSSFLQMRKQLLEQKPVTSRIRMFESNNSCCNFSVESSNSSSFSSPEKQDNNNNNNFSHSKRHKGFIIDESNGSVVDKFINGETDRDTFSSSKLIMKSTPKSAKRRKDQLAVGRDTVNGPSAADRLACDFSVEPMSPMSDISHRLNQRHHPKKNTSNNNNNILGHLQEKSLNAVQKMIDHYYLPQKMEDMLPDDASDKVFGLLDPFLQQTPVGTGISGESDTSSLPLRFDNEHSLGHFSTRLASSSSDGTTTAEDVDNKIVSQQTAAAPAATYSGEEEADEGSRVVLHLKSTATTIDECDNVHGDSNDANDGQETRGGKSLASALTHKTVELVGPKFREWAPDQLEVVLVEKIQPNTASSDMSTCSNRGIIHYKPVEENPNDEEKALFETKSKWDKYVPLPNSSTSKTSPHSSDQHSFPTHSSTSSLPSINPTMSYDTEDENPASLSPCNNDNSFDPVLKTKQLLPIDLEDKENAPHGTHQPLQVWVAKTPNPPILTPRRGTASHKQEDGPHQSRLQPFREKVDEDRGLIRSVRSEETFSSEKQTRLLEDIEKLLASSSAETRDDIANDRGDRLTDVTQDSTKTDFWQSSVETLQTLKGTQQSHRLLLTSLIAERNGAKATAETALNKLSQWTEKYQSQLNENNADAAENKVPVNVDQVARFTQRLNEISQHCMTIQKDNENQPKMYQSDHTIHSELLKIDNSAFELKTREITTLKVSRGEESQEFSDKHGDDFHLSLQKACLGMQDSSTGELSRTDRDVQSALAKLVAQETVVLRRKVEGLRYDLASEKETAKIQEENLKTKSSECDNLKLQLVTTNAENANNAEKVKSLERKVKELQKNNQKSMESKEKSLKYYKNRVVALDEELSKLQEREKASSKAESQAVASSQEITSHLRSALSVAERERTRASHKIEEISNELKKTQRELKTSDIENAELSLRVESLTSTKMENEATISEMEKEMQLNTSESEQMVKTKDAAISRCKEQISQLHSELTHMKKREKESSKMAKEELDSVREQFSKAQREMFVMKQERKEYSKKIESAHKEVESLKNELESTRRSLERSNADKTQLSLRLEKLTSLKKACDETIADLEGKKILAESELTESKELVKALENERLEVVTSRDALTLELEKVKQEISQKDEQLIAAKIESKETMSLDSNPLERSIDIDPWSDDKGEQLLITQMRLASLEEENQELRKALQKMPSTPKTPKAQSIDAIKKQRNEALAQLEEKNKSNEVLSEMLDSTRTDLSHSIVEISRLSMELDQARLEGRISSEIASNGSPGAIALLTDRIVKLELDLSTIATTRDTSFDATTHDNHQHNEDSPRKLTKDFRSLSVRFSDLLTEKEELVQKVMDLERSLTAAKQIDSHDSKDGKEIKTLREDIITLRKVISETKHKRDFFQVEFEKASKDNDHLLRCTEDLEKNVEEGLTQIEELTSHNEILDEKCSYLEDMLSDSRRMVDEKQESIDCLKLDIAALTSKLVKMQAKSEQDFKDHDSILEEFNFAEEQKDLLSDTLKSVENELAVKISETERLTSELEYVTAQNDEYATMIDNLKVKAAEVDDISSQLERISLENANYLEQIERLEHKLGKSQSNHQSYDVRKLESALAMSQESEAKLIKTMTQSNERDRREIVALREQCQNLQRDILVLETNLEGALCTKKTLADELDRTTCDLDQLKSETDRVSKTLKQTSAEKESLAAELVRQKSGENHSRTLERTMSEEEASRCNNCEIKNKSYSGDVEELLLRLEHAESLKGQYEDEIIGLKDEVIYLQNQLQSETQKTGQLEASLDKAQNERGHRQYPNDDMSLSVMSSMYDDGQLSLSFSKGGPATMEQVIVSGKRHAGDVSKLKDQWSLSQQREADVARTASKKISLLQHEITRLNSELQQNRRREAPSDELQNTKYSLECRVSDVAQLSMMLELIISDKEKCEQKIIALQRSNTEYLRGMRSILEQKNESLQHLNSALSALMDELSVLEERGDKSGTSINEIGIIEEDIAQLRESEANERAMRDETEKKIEDALKERRSLTYGLKLIKSEIQYYKERMHRVENALEAFQSKVEVVLSRFNAGLPPDTASDNKQLCYTIAKLSHELNTVLLYSEFQDKKTLSVYAIGPSTSNESFLVFQSDDETNDEASQNSKEIIKAVASTENRFFC